MTTTAVGASNDGHVSMDKNYKSLNAGDLQVIFYVVQATMVNDLPKHKIVRKLASDLQVD